MKELDSENEVPARRKRDLGQEPPVRKALEDTPLLQQPQEEIDEAVNRRQAKAAVIDQDANAGSDYDAMPDSDVPLAEPPAPKLSIPNSVFQPARILVNPRCVTTYAGVSHTQLALDLFGPDREVDGSIGGVGKYVLEDWEGAPESFVCQEQRQTGGRKATKTQRRLGFSIHDEMQRA